MYGFATYLKSQTKIGIKIRVSSGEIVTIIVVITKI